MPCREASGLDTPSSCNARGRPSVVSSSLSSVMHLPKDLHEIGTGPTIFEHSIKKPVR